MKYFITWEIEIDADSAHEAAKKALIIQRDKDSLATVFRVHAENAAEGEDIDLSDFDGCTL